MKKRERERLDILIELTDIITKIIKIEKEAKF